MQVNSFIFWCFFIALLIPYFTFLRKSAKAQNVWLLIASYIFFGYTEIKMLPVIIIATVLFYFLGIQIEKCNEHNPRKASILTTIGVVLGVGILVYFKYMNFLIEEFRQLLIMSGLQVNESSFKIEMLLGVSYFTFKLIGYLIAVHRGDMSASKDPISFALFVAFFPTLMAGPIDRAEQFIPQLQQNRLFKYENVSEGARRILWGMFMKMCIADIVCSYVDSVFNNYGHHSAITIIIASVLFFIQVYTDFCGYSNMAIGVGQIMGLKIKENFNRPYMAQNIAELWRRWHMSLTSWITDYIFMPLNVKFRNFGMFGLCLATLINMVVVGAWHGANWTYILFGLYHGICVCLITVIDKPRKKFEKRHKLKDKWYWVWPRRFFTWLFFWFSLIIFRANSIGDFFRMLHRFGDGMGSVFVGSLMTIVLVAIPSFAILMFKEWKDEMGYNIHLLHSEKPIVRYITFALMIVFILYLGELNGGSFIYFQF